LDALAVSIHRPGLSAVLCSRLAAIHFPARLAVGSGSERRPAVGLPPSILRAVQGRRPPQACPAASSTQTVRCGPPPPLAPSRRAGTLTPSPPCAPFSRGAPQL